MTTNNGRLAGKVALITGAAGGIGRAMVALFRSEGAEVVATDVVAPKLDCALALPLDVTSESEWREAMVAVERRLGRLDVLVNNAGHAVGRPATETTLAEWRKVMAINLDGTFLGLREAMLLMAKNREPAGGAIVNIASVAALIGAPWLAAYSAAKGAVVSLTRSAAIAAAESGSGIRVNALCPGFTDTPMLDGLAATLADRDVVKAKLARRQPLGRFCTAEEVAEAALYLASDAARYVTGTTLVIDGGFTAQ
ncbi:MAG TPA: SDR family oxidoreductase [Kiloniellales bacterium]|nr:SDR family oxidoreductase [Kiloniellales bacterium]